MRSGRGNCGSGLRTPVGSAIHSLGKCGCAVRDGGQRLADFPGFSELRGEDPAAGFAALAQGDCDRRVVGWRTAVAHDVFVDLYRQRTFYVLYEVFSGNYKQVLFRPKDIPGVWPMVRYYFFFGVKPPAREAYNPLQKLAYTSALILGVLSVVTGIAVW